MAENKKRTKREIFMEMKNIPAITENEEYVAFIDHELELLDRKSATAQNGEKKLTPTQIENEGIKDIIFEVLTANGEPCTVDGTRALDERIGQYSNQKISRLMNAMVDDGRLEKFVSKRTTYFKIAE